MHNNFTVPVYEALDHWHNLNLTHSQKYISLTHSQKYISLTHSQKYISLTHSQKYISLTHSQYPFTWHTVIGRVPTVFIWLGAIFYLSCHRCYQMSQPQVAQSIQDNEVSKTPYFRYIFNLRYNIMKFTSMVSWYFKTSALPEFTIPH